MDLEKGRPNFLCYRESEKEERRRKKEKEFNMFLKFKCHMETI